MFHVPNQETVTQAEAHGLRLVLAIDQPSHGEVNVAAGVSWTRVLFVGD